MDSNTNYVQKFGKEKLMRMYMTMNEIRDFEENISSLYQKGLSYGGLHLAVGEEACAVGSIFPLSKEDLIVTYHRGHGHMIAKGSDVKQMVAELRAKADGFCKGRGGSVHLMDMSCGQYGAQGIVGAQGTVSAGVALSGRIQKKDYVTLCFFGDGAAGQGQMHEGINLASVLKLPVVYICINNGYAVSTPSTYSCPGQSIADRAAGYGIPGTKVDGNNVFEVYEAVEEAVKWAREGNGPSLIELTTYRWYGHYLGDPCKYRTQEELNYWKENRDPIKFLKAFLLDNKVCTDEELKQLEDEAAELIAEANAFAEASPEPTIESMWEDIYYTANGK